MIGDFTSQELSQASQCVLNKLMMCGVAADELKHGVKLLSAPKWLVMLSMYYFKDVKVFVFNPLTIPTV